MRRLALMLAVTAVVATPALAQDSTAPDAFYTIGDAVLYNDTTEQINTFVVDTAPITSSWGNAFRIAPLVKSSKTSFNYLSSLMSSQGMSRDQLAGVEFPFESYSLWTAPFQGVNAAANEPPASIVDTTGWSGNQFSVAFSEYGTGDEGGNLNGIIGAVVNYLPEEPSRLYVARVAAAQNSELSSENRAQFGFGSVDAHGNVHFRADDYQVGTNPPIWYPIAENNHFRVRLVDTPTGTGRDGSTLNVIDLYSDDDPTATDWILQFYQDTSLGCPTIIPESVASRPVLLAGTYNWTYVYEMTALAATIDVSHRAAGTTGHRGSLNFSPLLTCVQDSVGTAGLIAYSGATGFTHVLNMMDVDANGVVLNKYGLVTPQTYSNLPPNNVTFGGPANGGAKFDHYHGTSFFRGGPQVAIGKDQAGRGMAAAVLYDLNAFNEQYQNPYNAVAVARFNCGDHVNADWALAGYIAQTDDAGTTNDPTDDSWDGSPVYGGPNGDTVIGRLAPLYAIDGLTGNTRGPSMSAPAMDAVGNIYFLSAFERYEPNYVSSGIFRAVYDPATFSYKLELVVEYSEIFDGLNSTVSYRVAYLDIRYSSTVSSGTIWAGNICQTGYAGMDVSNLDPADPRTLGGLVFYASIVYDSDGDGDHGSPDGMNQDQEYNVLMLLTGDGELGPVGCPGDSNCDGSINWRDIDFFVAAQNDNLSAWNALHLSVYGTPPTCPFENNDVDGSGSANWRDIDPFVALQNTTCP